MVLIYGLIGEKLGGKDTAAEYMVAKFNATHIRHSHILDEILAILNIPISRRNEIDLGMALRAAFGEGILNKALVRRVQESTKKLIVVNGIRFPEELENIQALGAKIIYVTAPEQIRYERFLKRQEKADDATQTVEEFRHQEQEPTEVQIPTIGVKADFRIDNVGTLEELYKKIDTLVSGDVV